MDETGTHEIQITLRNYWYETISPEEALSRLEGRNLSPETHSEVRRSIPEGDTHHFLTFHGGAFREYVDFPDETAKLLLILPAEQKEENRVEVAVPVITERAHDGRRRKIYGIDFHEYEFVNNMLVENGSPKETFQFVEDAIELRIDASFISPEGPRLMAAAHPGGSGCCRACEWVHSRLDIHCADDWCCLGQC